MIACKAESVISPWYLALKLETKALEAMASIFKE